MAWKFSVLVVANVTAASDELLAALKNRAEHRECGFTVLVPATGGGKLDTPTGDAYVAVTFRGTRVSGHEFHRTTVTPRAAAPSADVSGFFFATRSSKIIRIFRLLPISPT